MFVLAGVWLVALMYFRTAQSGAGTPRAGVAADHAARGQWLYQTNCAICHGESGDGNGVAARQLDPKPRDFKLGKYRLISSANMIPFREDLIRTIREGMAGTSMPAWLHLPAGDIEALADHVFSLTKETEREKLRQRLVARRAKLDRLETMLADRTTPGDAANPGPEPKVGVEDLAKARPLYNQACGKCHGENGEGMADPAWRTEEGLAIASRNFTSGVYKGGGRGQDIYRRIYAGIPGTPMPGFASLSDAEIWSLVHYVQSLAGTAPVAAGSTADPINNGKK
jgi:mono/diheme cytochrome c family protein